MDHMGVDLMGQRLFAAAFDNHTMEVIDLQAGRQVHTIANLNQPQAAFYDPSTNRLFVPSGGDGTVKIFDGHTLFQLETSGTRVFINVPDKKEILVADLTNNNVLAHWAVQGCTDNFPMALDEPHHRLFVAWWSRSFWSHLIVP
jgi:DNA-binding beta-propeller fold protein YncE